MALVHKILGARFMGDLARARGNLLAHFPTVAEIICRESGYQVKAHSPFQVYAKLTGYERCSRCFK